MSGVVTDSDRQGDNS